MKCGDIHWALLHPRSGSEQSGRRPVLVVSDDGFNRVPSWRSMIVVPFSTSSKQASRGLTTVVVPRGVGGLQSESVALCHQVTTLDRGKLSRRIGTLPASYLYDVGLALRAAMALL